MQKLSQLFLPILQNFQNGYPWDRIVWLRWDAHFRQPTIYDLKYLNTTKVGKSQPYPFSFEEYFETFIAKLSIFIDYESNNEVGEVRLDDGQRVLA